ncbi:putative phytoene dehydrogenase [Phycisphaera mikurensis NBRC 102666]|uniref:Putative phytoene dehydrogenase n=2 Tax=Phycisphaera TaxID=666508 RepID=I0IFU9_PHYMF|nr:putative phytoene dehydrogenase [Phycisphaera mikurensis NBRC 102666]
MTSPPGAAGTAVVVGGGVAGVAAAVALADAGVRVTLLEQRGRLGGRATSVDDAKAGGALDNGQHVVMRSCTQLLALYRRLGTAGELRWAETLHFADPDDPSTLHPLKGDDLPAPLHLVRPLLGFGLLTLGERLSVARASLAALQTGRSSWAARGEESFADWLAEHKQGEAEIQKFWRPMIVSACNEEPAGVAAGVGLQVLCEGVMSRDDGLELGVAAVPLADLLAPAIPIIEAAGGEVRTGTTATGFDLESGRVAGVTLNSGESLAADHVVAAVPADRLAALLPGGLAGDDRLTGLDALGYSPIVSVHLLLHAFDGGVVLPAERVALPGRPIHWMFETAAPEGAEDAQNLRHVRCVVSAARNLVDLPAGEITEIAMREVRRLVPGKRVEARHSRVIKERHATFSVAPGSDAHRPAAAGPSGLLLAGDWTATGWPATMEGAARSGAAAAAAALGEDHRPAAPEASLLYRVIAG